MYRRIGKGVNHIQFPESVVRWCGENRLDLGICSLVGAGTAAYSSFPIVSLNILPAFSTLSELHMDIACPHCRELVREHCVRCWNCRSFLYSETAEYYDQMLQQRDRQSLEEGSGWTAAETTHPA